MMARIAGILIGMLAAPLLMLSSAVWAQVPAQIPAECEVPSYLLISDAGLPHVADAIKKHAPFTIVVIGTGSSRIIGTEGAAGAYPYRLDVALQKRIGSEQVKIVTQIMPRRTTGELAIALKKAVVEIKPTLVIWQTGTVDAIRGIDPDKFQAALKDGVAAARSAGADIMLMNMQYSPRTEMMIPLSSYHDLMRIVSQQMNVPLFDRFAIMHYWNETGQFDLFAPTHTTAQAKRVHDCIGRALALLIVSQARISSPDLKVMQ